MAQALVWVTGASRGIGQALVHTVPWQGARVIGISRQPPANAEHLRSDLADPSSWSEVADSFRRELASFAGERVAFVQAAGTIEPLGFTGEVPTEAYATNVVLNSAAPQVLGHMFLAAVRAMKVERHLVMLSSGAASSIYAGWAPYGAAKAATDQWVRDVGAEQTRRGGVKVLSVAPGTVDTAMQEQLRATTEEAFPQRQKFLDLHREGRLSDPDEVARHIWALLDRGLDNGAVVDLRSLGGDGG